MSINGYSAITAAREHLLEGHSLTRLEALVLFGNANFPDLIRSMRKQGWIIQSRSISYAAALQRMKGQARVEPPKNLPIRELQLTEYWVSR